MNQKHMETSVLKQEGNNEKPKNDSKSVFVINKSKFYNNENTGNTKQGQLNQLPDQINNRGGVLGGNSANVAQPNKQNNEDVRYPLKSDLDKVAAIERQANAEQQHNLPVDLKINPHVGANNNNPVDVNDPNKLNEAYKDLAKKPKTGLPVNLNIIDGEVEKNKGPQLSVDYDDGDDATEEQDDNGAQRSDIEVDRKDRLSNEIPRDMGAPLNVNDPNRQIIQGPNAGQQNNYYGQQNNGGQQFNMNNGQQFHDGRPVNGGQQMNNGQLGQNNDNKEGSLKVVWDWSDFAVNFEQYIAPEQKIRRAPHATTGEPWPLPQYYVTKQDVIYRIDKSVFHFKLSKVKCDIIDKAIERYKSYILEDSVEEMYDNFQHAQSTVFEDPSLKYETSTYTEAPTHALVSVKIRNPCAKLPGEKMDESCKFGSVNSKQSIGAYLTTGRALD